jgi:hypothetical protein
LPSLGFCLWITLPKRPFLSILCRSFLSISQF